MTPTQHSDTTTTDGTFTPVVRIPMPDPSLIPWEERAWMRALEADRYRRDHGYDGAVGVDIVPSGIGRYGWKADE